MIETPLHPKAVAFVWLAMSELGLTKEEAVALKNELKNELMRRKPLR